MTEIEIIRQQRDMLFNACKSAATDKKCPDWISKILSQAAINAKKLQENFVPSNDMQISKTLELNAIVRSNKPNDTCLYKIINVGMIIQDVQLFDVVIVKGNSKNPEGCVIHNVPATMLVTSN